MEPGPFIIGASLVTTAQRGEVERRDAPLQLTLRTKAIPG